MRARFLGKDPESNVGDSSTLRVTDRTDRNAQSLGLPDHDYWLFDSRTLALMNFDDDDRFTGAQIIEDAAMIVEHNYWRDAAWHYAVRRDGFATE
jgi:hypothetical protein